MQEARTMICFTQKLNRRISLRIRTFLSPIRTDNSYADAPDQEKHQQFQLEHVTVKRVSQSAAARGYRLRCAVYPLPSLLSFGRDVAAVAMKKNLQIVTRVHAHYTTMRCEASSC